MRAVIVANGDPPPNALLVRLAAHCDLLVCTDGGAATAVAAGLSPHLVLGDMDSLDAPTAAAVGGSEILVIEEQDTTDLEKALYTCLGRGVTEVVLLGAGGRRWDQFLSSMGILARYADRLAISAEDEWGRLELVAPGSPYFIRGQAGDKVSLVPLRSAAGVVTAGLRWVPEPDLDLIGSQWVSNEIATSPATVTYQIGCLAVYYVRPHPHP